LLDFFADFFESVTIIVTIVIIEIVIIIITIMTIIIVIIVTSLNIKYEFGTAKYPALLPGQELSEAE